MNEERILRISCVEGSDYHIKNCGDCPMLLKFGNARLYCSITGNDIAVGGTKEEPIEKPKKWPDEWPNLKQAMCPLPDENTLRSLS